MPNERLEIGRYAIAKMIKDGSLCVPRNQREWDPVPSRFSFLSIVTSLILVQGRAYLIRNCYKEPVMWKDQNGHAVTVHALGETFVRE